MKMRKEGRRVDIDYRGPSSQQIPRHHSKNNARVLVIVMYIDGRNPQDLYSEGRFGKNNQE